MATRETVIEDITNHVTNKFGGDWRKAFDSYANNGKLGRDDLMTLLIEASVGSRLTRGYIADKILAEMDADKDGAITFSEFESVK